MKPCLAQISKSQSFRSFRYTKRENVQSRVDPVSVRRGSFRWYTTPINGRPLPFELNHSFPNVGTVNKDNYDLRVCEALLLGQKEMGEVPGDLSTNLENPKRTRKNLKNLLTLAKKDFSEDFCTRMDEILMYELSLVQSKITDVDSLPDINEVDSVKPCKISVWQGDITLLKIGAIVNAANKGMCGCFIQGHMCIDNIIHDKSGPRLRMECRQMMRKQGKLEETGKAKLTKGYCLPADFVLHTVGPIAEYEGHEQPELLASSYRECLNLAKANNIRSVAFCCISTGIFGYPQGPASSVAMGTVKSWLEDEENQGSMDCVVFNVFKNEDLMHYKNNMSKFFLV